MASHKIVIILMLIVVHVNLRETSEHQHTDSQTNNDQIKDNETMIQNELPGERINERHTDIEEDEDEIFRPKRSIWQRRVNIRIRLYRPCFPKKQTICRWIWFRNRWKYICFGKTILKCV